MNHFVFLIIIYLFFLNPILSLEKEKILGFDLYEPGIFNPLGPTLLYGDSDLKKRPYMLIAINEKGQIVEKSLLQYSKEGKLIAEKIFNSKNEQTGEIQYVYDSLGKVIKEIYLDNNKNLISYKKREYYQDKLISIQFYDKENLTFTRKYNYENTKITGREYGKDFSEPFFINLSKGLVQSLEFKEKNKTLMKIEYIYEGNRLIQRKKESLESKSKCIYEYDSSSRLKSYTYYDFIRNEWKKTKTIQFIYADQI